MKEYLNSPLLKSYKMLIIVDSENAPETKTIVFFLPSFFRDCFLTLYHLLLRIVQQVRYVLEKSSVQLEHQASAPARSVVTDLTKQ